MRTHHRTTCTRDCPDSCGVVAEITDLGDGAAMHETRVRLSPAP